MSTTELDFLTMTHSVWTCLTIIHLRYWRHLSRHKTHWKRTHEAWIRHQCDLRVPYRVHCIVWVVFGMVGPRGGMRPLGPFIIRSSDNVKQNGGTMESSSYLLQLILTVCENTRRLCGRQRPRRHVWHSWKLNKHTRAGFKGNEMMAGGTEQQLSARWLPEARPALTTASCLKNNLEIGATCFCSITHCCSNTRPWLDNLGCVCVCVCNCAAKYSTKRQNYRQKHGVCVVWEKCLNAHGEIKYYWIRLLNEREHLKLQNWKEKLQRKDWTKKKDLKKKI